MHPTNMFLKQIVQNVCKHLIVPQNANDFKLVKIFINLRNYLSVLLK